jgi:hypothetical protein
MTAIARLLAVLLGAPSPHMSQLLALDEAAFARRVRGRQRPDSASPNDPGAAHARGHAGGLSA